ncbi:hypothetical protein LCGC14_1069960 [marine sediment metagenome]|uniref:Uncharacterized protein n=1 Tax=marine sediment metagenome TaxID=412755 RepID=A0A0F9N5P6_9ZZZZ
MAPKTCSDCSPPWKDYDLEFAIELCPLHAATPELLEACQEALLTITERCKIEGINPDASPTVIALCTAIKAAKGDV